MKYRVAVASTDGKVINQHFGKAESFHIFEISEDGTYHFIESRNVDSCCRGGGHETGAFEDVSSTLWDVQAILVGRIGEGASDYMERRGFVVYEAPFLINSVMERIINDRLYKLDDWKIVEN